MAEWLSVQEVADLLEISRSTVVRTFASEATADKTWGAEGWRLKPLTRRKEYQVRRSVAEALANRRR